MKKINKIFMLSFLALSTLMVACDGEVTSSSSSSKESQTTSQTSNTGTTSSENENTSSTSTSLSGGTSTSTSFGSSTNPVDQKYTIKGKFIDSSDKSPVSGIEVKLTKDGSVNKGLVTSDSKGEFVFENLDSGVYSLLFAAESDKYEASSSLATITLEGDNYIYTIPDILLKKNGTSYGPLH